MKKRFIILVLVVFAVIIFAPPIVRGYTYPTIGQDTASHLVVLDKIKIGSPLPEIWVRYYGYYIIGYPLDLVNRITNISKDTLFFWFNYVALFGVGISLFYIFNKLFGAVAGILALIVPTFTSYAVLLLYYSGAIFDYVNVGIILPFTIYMVIKAVTTRRKRFWVVAVILGGLFMIFHTTGVYFPFYVVAGFLCYLLWKLVRKQRICKKDIAVTLIMVGGGLFFIVGNPLRISFESDGFFGLALVQKTLFYYLSVPLTIIIGAGLVYLISKRKEIFPNEQLALAAFGIPAATLLPAILFGWSQQPFRQGLDMAILLSLIAVILIVVAARLDKSRLSIILVVALVVWGSTTNLSNWMFNYNSAVSKVDIEAIKYVNSLPINSYSVSHNIDQVIYGRFIKKSYTPIRGKVILTRSVSMSSNGVLPAEDIDLTGKKEIKVFSDGEVTVGIYQ